VLLCFCGEPTLIIGAFVEAFLSTFVVIIAGGAGTRFWPAGRRARPKQLLPVAGDRSLLAETLERCAPLAGPDRTFVVTNAIQREATRRECPDVPKDHVVAEPEMRNTAAAIGLAALRVRRADPEGVMVVLPADHVIRPREKFVATFKAAAGRAGDEDVLICVGIKPTGPATGYGYIEAGDEVAQVDGYSVHKVGSFKEKPDAATAGSFIESGRYFWNAGTFVWKAATILEAFKKYLPQHYEILKELDRDGDPSAELYARFENVPIDIGIMEKASNVEVIPADFEWDDAGSWLALARLRPRDDDGNTVHGDFVGIDSRNCLVISPDHLVATIGLQDMIVVHTPDATLICPKSRAEEVKSIVEQLRERGRDELL
jgi:mannose-1-phosphate guanylyltransferase